MKRGGSHGQFGGRQQSSGHLNERKAKNIKELLGDHLHGQPARAGTGLNRDDILLVDAEEAEYPNGAGEVHFESPRQAHTSKTPGLQTNLPGFAEAAAGQSNAETLVVSASGIQALP